MFACHCFAWPVVHVGDLRAWYSLASVAKLLRVSDAVTRFAACLVALGSAPFANSLRASIRPSLALLRLVSGYTPSDSVFSFPAKRYLSRQYFAPLGCTKRYSPPPSDNLNGLSVASTFLIATSVSGILVVSPKVATRSRWGYYIYRTEIYPQYTPNCCKIQ